MPEELAKLREEAFKMAEDMGRVLDRLFGEIRSNVCSRLGQDISKLTDRRIPPWEIEEICKGIRKPPPAKRGPEIRLLL